MNLMEFLRLKARWIAGGIALIFIVSTLVPVLVEIFSH